MVSPFVNTQWSQLSQDQDRPPADRTTTQHCCKANDTANRTSIHHGIKMYSVAKTSTA
jgi:hypothetical protein